MWKWRAAWIGLLLSFVIGLIIIESLALSRDDGLSLSQLTADASHAWPPIIFLFGLAVGILVSHFWWPWVPKQKRATCGKCGKTLLIE